MRRLSPRNAPPVNLPFLLVAVLVFGIALFGLFYSRSFPEEGAALFEQYAMPHPAVIAHRGASAVAPESTAPAYRRAIEMGADYLEADLRRTADGRIVVHHDATPARTSNAGELFPGRSGEPLGRYTYEELGRVDFGNWFNQAHPLRSREEYRGLSILTLRELIAIADSSPRRTGLVLELKDPAKYPGIEEEVVEILKKEGWIDSAGVPTVPGSLIFFSFNLEALKDLQQLVPRVPRVFLISGEMISWARWRFWLRRAAGIADGVGAKGFFAWPWYIAGAHDRGLFVLPYVVNEVWQLKLITEYRADGYITDRPGFVREFVDALSDASE